MYLKICFVCCFSSQKIPGILPMGKWMSNHLILEIWLLLAPSIWRVPYWRHLIKRGWNCDVCIMHTCWHYNNHTAYSSKNVIISNLCVYIQSLSLKKTLSKEQWIERVANIYFILLGIFWVLGPKVGITWMSRWNPARFRAEEKESKLVSIKQIRQDWARFFCGENTWDVFCHVKLMGTNNKRAAKFMRLDGFLKMLDPQ